MTVSPSVTCSVPAASVSLTGIVPRNVALPAAVSVSRTVSPPGSVVESMVTVVVSIVLSSVLRSQSTTRIVAAS